LREAGSSSSPLAKKNPCPITANAGADGVAGALSCYNAPTGDDAMDELLTVRDVALLCKLHEVTVRRHISQGRLKAVRLGTRVRVRKEDLDAYIEPAEASTELAKPSRKSRSRRLGRPFTKDDPLWSIVGMIDEPGTTWISSDKHRALADAYEPKP
jgi:excisionase family DNA binding protein